jgi:hypothetical protein
MGDRRCSRVELCETSMVCIAKQQLSAQAMKKCSKHHTDHRRLKHTSAHPYVRAKPVGRNQLAHFICAQVSFQGTRADCVNFQPPDQA